jgi:NADH dehydrogenase
MILVAGGTGRLGSLVVSRLAAQGVAVRVLTRDRARAERLVGVATEIVEGDVRDRPSIERSVEGCRTVVSAVHGFAGPGRVTPASVDRDGNANLVAAAEAVGADMVLVSVVGASPDNPMELFRAKYDAEQHLRASGAPWTIVRATAFVELWAEIMSKGIVFGKGDNPINFVSVADVAAVVERAVVDTGLRKMVLEVGGPQNMTFNELATLLQKVRGGPAKVRHVPRWLLRTMAPVGRQPRAAVTMDTVDMTFDAQAAHHAFADLPMTDIQIAVTDGTSSAGHREQQP